MLLISPKIKSTSVKAGERGAHSIEPRFPIYFPGVLLSFVKKHFN